MQTAGLDATEIAKAIGIGRAPRLPTGRASMVTPCAVTMLLTGSLSLVSSILLAI